MGAGSQAGNLEELAEQADIESLIPPAVEQDARLVDLQEVAERLLAFGAAQRGELDEGAHRTLLPTGPRSAHVLLHREFAPPPPRSQSPKRVPRSQFLLKSRQSNLTTFSSKVAVL